MRYLKYWCHADETWKEVIMAELAEVGFESFDDSKPGKLEAWVQEKEHRAEATKSIFEAYAMHINDYGGPEHEPEVNWNATWESDYQPVSIDDFVYIRAPFHEQPKTTYEHVIEIMPKMSFGTGHHGTTAGIMREMREIQFDYKDVLDMGCGTGVLGILAGKMGASKVVGIDIEAWAVENAIENAERNEVKMEVLEGGKEKISGVFDVILANINRNIIIDQLPFYARHLKKDGHLLCSGFYQGDVDIIRENAALNSFIFERESNEHNWATVVFRKG
mgnify:CR=1 FL=1